MLVNPTDYFLYLPLLPEVATGVVDPRRISVSLTATLPGVRLVLGEVDAVDIQAQRISWTDPEGGRGGISGCPAGCAGAAVSPESLTALIL